MNKVVAGITILPLLLVAAEWQRLDGPPAGRADDMSMGLYESEWVIYAADQTHKLYKSTNDGEYWDSLTYYDVTKNPVCVITRPGDAQVVYIGKDDDTPVWWSEDGGANWEDRSGSGQHYITNTKPLCFAMDPNNSNILFLGCSLSSAEPEMFKTINGGTDWSALSNCPNTTINEIAIRPNYSNTIIIATDDGLYRSTNGGANWSENPIFAKTQMKCISFGNQDYVYAGREMITEGFYKSTNCGDDWSLVGNFNSVTAVTAVSATEVYIVGDTNSEGRGIYRTTNGGANWTYYGRNRGLFCNDKIDKLLFHPDYATDSLIFSAGDWAVYRLDGPGADWQTIVTGFRILQSDSILNISDRDFE